MSFWKQSYKKLLDFSQKIAKNKKLSITTSCLSAGIIGYALSNTDSINTPRVECKDLNDLEYVDFKSHSKNIECKNLIKKFKVNC
jgi:hypothetical protein